MYSLSYCNIKILGANLLRNAGKIYCMLENYQNTLFIKGKAIQVLLFKMFKSIKLYLSILKVYRF